MAHSDASTRAADVPKRKREVSEEERVKVQARRDVSQTRRRPRLRPPPAADAQLNVVLRLIEQAKEKVENTIKQAHDELKESRAQQAEARLKYLLSQSDIFSHFGLGKGKGGNSASSSSSAAASSSSVVVVVGGGGGGGWR